jgi:AcrR family transcriptional regulator
MTQATGTTRSGGRTARTRAAVHAATRELLDSSADGTVEMAAVAELSGVHIATLYRRWRTPEGLIVDTIVSELSTRSPLPATGDLRADLTVWVTTLLTDLSRPSHLSFVRALIAIGKEARDEGADVPSFAEPRAQEIQATLDAAGVTDLTWWDVFDLVLGPAYMRALLSAPMDPTTDVQRLVDNVMAVVEHRART